MAMVQARKGVTGTSYRVFVKKTGFPVLTKTFKRKTDAEKWARQQEADIEARRVNPNAIASKTTVADMFKRYCETILPTKDKTTISAQTQQIKVIVDFIGHKFIADLTTRDISILRDELRKRKTPEGGTLSDSTINRYMACLSHAFSIAVKEWQITTNNPMLAIKKLKEPRERVRFLSKDDELPRLLDACRKSSYRQLYALVIGALSTGLRASELMRIKWEDIDKGTRRIIIEHTKNDERRYVPVTEPFLKAIDALSGLQRRVGAPYLFSDKRNALFPRKAWEKALKEADIKDFTFHDLKHTGASYMAMSNSSLAEIAQFTGHKSLEMVRRYTHLTDQHLSSTVERMTDAFLSGAVAKVTGKA